MLDELVEILREVCHVEAKPSTIYDALRRRGLSYKKVCCRSLLLLRHGRRLTP